MSSTTNGKPKTPGYKALLVPESVFKRLQGIQLDLPLPRRLSVADLASGALELTLEQHDTKSIVDKATLLLTKNLSQHFSKE